MTRLSVLVSLRDDSPTKERTTLWEFIRARFEREMPEAEIVVGTDDGTPFNKCKALNRAAAEATGDVFYITDADSWVAPAMIRQGIELLARHAWVKPWRTKCKLGPEGTAEVLALGEDWDGTLGIMLRKDAESRSNGFPAAPPLLLTRETFFDVGGMDERFGGGWGGEDSALYRALIILRGRAEVMNGECIHLNHPRLGRSGRDRWEGQDSPDANNALLREYVRARTPEQMRELIAARSLVTARGRPGT
jgi:hypothetical protein